MFSILVFAMLGQFKVGDEVMILDNVRVYRTSYDAILRNTGGGFASDFIGKVIAVQEIDGEQVIRIEDPRRESPVWSLSKEVRHFDAAAKADRERRIAAQIEFNNRQREIESDPETKARMEKFAKEKEAEEKANAKAEKDKAYAAKRIESLRKFVRTEPEKEAYEFVTGKGWDPLDLTADQVNKLSPSQRKAISGIKLRYIKAQRAKK